MTNFTRQVKITSNFLNWAARSVFWPQPFAPYCHPHTQSLLHILYIYIYTGACHARTSDCGALVALVLDIPPLSNCLASPFHCLCALTNMHTHAIQTSANTPTVIGIGRRVLLWDFEMPLLYLKDPMWQRSTLPSAQAPSYPRGVLVA